MKKKILGAGLILGLMLTATSGMALKMEQLEGKTVRISGNTGNPGEMVALDVYVGDKSRADLLNLTPAEYLNCIVTRMQTETDGDGEYVFEFDIDLPNSKYVAYSGTENQEFEPYNFVFVSDENFENMAEEINDADVLRIKEILEDEKVEIESLVGHGGYFKTDDVGQYYMALACGSNVTCMETAGEGGPFGMAVLAA